LLEEKRLEFDAVGSEGGVVRVLAAAVMEKFESSVGDLRVAREACRQGGWEKRRCPLPEEEEDQRFALTCSAAGEGCY